MPVPGFRPGRAPRQLIVKRFRKQVSQQVKSNLLMSSLDQIDKEYKLEPIVQPRPMTVDSLICALRSIVLRSATVQSRIAASSPT